MSADHPLADLLAEFNALTPEVEDLKRACGHGDHEGWSLGGEPYEARCGCGVPIADLVAPRPIVIDGYTRIAWVPQIPSPPGIPPVLDDRGHAVTVDPTAHVMMTRRFQGHHTSVWCSCGWSVPEPVKLVRKSEMVELWRGHLSMTDADGSAPK